VAVKARTALPAILQTSQRKRQGSHVLLRYAQRRANRYQSPETPTLSREAFFVINDVRGFVVMVVWPSGRALVVPFFLCWIVCLGPQHLLCEQINTNKNKQ